MKIYHPLIVLQWNMLCRLTGIKGRISKNPYNYDPYKEEDDCYYVDAEEMMQDVYFWRHEMIDCPSLIFSQTPIGFIKWKIALYLSSKLYENLIQNYDAIIVVWDIRKYRSKLAKEFEKNYRKYKNKEN